LFLFVDFLIFCFFVFCFCDVFFFSELHLIMMFCLFVLSTFIDEKGVAKKATWDQFLSWFTPLGVPDMYQTGAAASDGWTVDIIVDIGK
jgi:hypothetical protein